MSINIHPKSELYQQTTYDKVTTSVSAAKYGFSKQPRFTTSKYNCESIGYTLPSTLSPKCSGFGFGVRKVFMGKQDSASPDRYSIPTPFNPEDSVQQKNSAFALKRTSYCFGTARNQIKNVLSKQNLPADPVNPGPGTYSDKTSSIGVNARKTTVHARNFYLNSTDIAKKRGVPGPGTYEDQQATPSEGHYQSSQMVNSKAAKINTGRRFLCPDLGVPGPGAYEQIGQVQDGNQTCTNFHSTITRSFKTTDVQRPELYARFKTPGPGTYRPPSDFGYMDIVGQTSRNYGEGSQAGRFSTITGGCQTSRFANTQQSFMNKSAREQVNHTTQGTFGHKKRSGHPSNLLTL